MTKEIEYALLLRLNDHFANQMGLYLPPSRMEDMRKNLKAVAKEFSMEPADCAYWLLKGPLSKNQIDVVAYHFTVGETYFFRDSKIFEVLEDEVLWKLIRERRNTSKHLRFWSAACCTGEEPYSLAMLLRRLLSDIDSWQVSILATDINQSFLKKARHGVYGDWSFRVTSSAIKERFFTPTSHGKFEIAPEIKKMVHFATLNLVNSESMAGVVPCSMDVIMCRNVLMYFHQDQVEPVLRKFHAALADGGVLIVNPIELMYVPEELFDRPTHSGAILRKRSLDQAVAPAQGDTKIFPTVVDCVRQNLPSPAIEQSIVPQPRPMVPQHEAGKMDFAEQAADSLTGSKCAEEAKELFLQGRYAECVQHLLKHNQEDLNDPADFMLLARAYSNDGELKAALQWIDKAIEHDRLNHTLYYVRATILQALSDVGEAIASLRQALFLEPQFVVAEFYLASLLHQSGKKMEAGQRFRSALLLLKQYNEDDVVPESEGITAGHLAQIVQSLLLDAHK